MLNPTIVRLFPNIRSTKLPGGILAGLVALDSDYRNRRHVERLESHLRRDAGLDKTPSEQGLAHRTWNPPLWWR